MTTQTNRIAIALCESAGVKPYYPGKVNRWQWESYLPEARRLVEVTHEPYWISNREAQRLYNANLRMQVDRMGLAGADGLIGTQDIPPSQLGFQGRGQGKPEVINTDRRWWQLW